MPGNEIATDDAGKTGTLLSLGNLILAPLYWADTRLGLSASILATAAFLYGAHEVGKNRRPLENATNRANSFFGAKTGDKSTEVENALANIAVGGAAMFDELFPENKVKPK